MTEIDIAIEAGITKALPVSVAFEPPPSGLNAVANVGGGTFAAGTYYWVVTGTDSYGETTASNEASVAVALNGTATLTWNALPVGTTGVKVYRGTAPGAENALIATLGAVVTYTDTGAAGSAATPPTVNTAQIGDQRIISGHVHLMGYAIRETSGVNPASLSIRGLDNEFVPIQIPVSGVANAWFGPGGIDSRYALVAHANSGLWTGEVYVRFSKWE